MTTPMPLEEFLKSQGSGFTATLEPVPDKPAMVRVTPFRDDHGCGCSSGFELAKRMIRSVIPTGKHHFCCGKRLEVAVIEFTEDASVPVADLISRAERPTHTGPHPHAEAHQARVGGRPFPARTAAGRSAAHPALVGRWPIPFTNCELECIEVCTEFCSDTGWDCCGWETRCVINCDGIPVWHSY